MEVTKPSLKKWEKNENGRGGEKEKKNQTKIEVIPGFNVESGETLQQINISENILKRQLIILPALKESRNIASHNCSP